MFVKTKNSELLASARANAIQIKMTPNQRRDVITDRSLLNIIEQNVHAKQVVMTPSAPELRHQLL